MKFKVIQKIALSFLFLLIIFFNTSSAEEKKYPPYPDEWGYELPWFKENDKDSRPCRSEPSRSKYELPCYKNDKHIFKDAGKMLDGDYLIIYEIYKLERGIFERYSLPEGILFFSGKRFTGEEIQKIEGGKYLGYKELFKIEFSDGSRIEITNPYFKDGSGKCAPTIYNFIEKKDKNARVIFEKALIYLPNNPKEEAAFPICKVHQGVGWYLIKKVEQMAPRFVPLDDGTFLVADEEGKAAIRFDKDLNTKSDLLNTKIFIVDKKVIDGLIAKAVNDQDRIEAVYKYIQQKKLKKEE